MYDAVGRHQLDASIMDGHTLACGTVAGLGSVKNPINLARLVMKRSGHVLLIGDGAEQFAGRMGVERVDNSYFDTPVRLAELRQKLNALKENAATPYKNRGTVGAVARDRNRHLAAATSTGGMTAKMFGRVGDSPLIGAGTYADDRTAAVSCTGVGEQFIRHAVAYDVSARIAYGGASLRSAVDSVIHRTLQPDDGGLIAVNSAGEIVMEFNTRGMYRGAAASDGRFDVHIFKE